MSNSTNCCSNVVCSRQCGSFPGQQQHFFSLLEIGNHKQGFLEDSVDPVQIGTLDREPTADETTLSEQSGSAHDVCTEVNGHNVDVLYLVVDRKKEQDQEPSIVPVPVKEHDSAN